MLGHRPAVLHFNLLEPVGIVIDIEISRDVAEIPEMVPVGGAIGKRKIPHGQLDGNPS
jgi:hypothetical protein